MRMNIEPPIIAACLHNGAGNFLTGFGLKPADHIFNPGFGRFIADIDQPF